MLCKLHSSSQFRLRRRARQGTDDRAIGIGMCVDPCPNTRRVECSNSSFHPRHTRVTSCGCTIPLRFTERAEWAEHVWDYVRQARQEESGHVDVYPLRHHTDERVTECLTIHGGVSRRGPATATHPSCSSQQLSRSAMIQLLSARDYCAVASLRSTAAKSEE